VETLAERGQRGAEEDGSGMGRSLLCSHAIARSKERSDLSGISPSVNFWIQPDFRDGRGHVELPFPTMRMEKKRYKVFGLVTNRDVEGNELIHWLHQRCGKSEELIRS